MLQIPTTPGATAARLDDPGPFTERGQERAAVARHGESVESLSLPLTVLPAGHILGAKDPGGNVVQ